MNKILIFFFCVLSQLSFSQEVVSNLISNSEISKNKRIISINKSDLSIPFIDDFSSTSTIPDSVLWEDNSVFVNRNYGVNPITIGVATFDGLDANGRAYDMNLTGTDAENADTLKLQDMRI
ncbi:MAG: hypothetical protein HN677_02075, partial [Flavobacteriales bacterium]|nr:hypothetical protein [Flavobacteriales bacterium]